MTQVFLYDSDDLGTSVVRLGKLGPLSVNAFQAVPGEGSLDLDDPLGELDIVGLKGFAIDETAGPDAMTLTGTVSKTSGSGAFTGSGTAFLTELQVGRTVKIPGTADEYFRVSGIADDTHFSADQQAVNSASGQTATVTEQHRLHSSFVGQRDVARGSDDSLVTGVAHRWHLTLIDFNTYLTFHVFTESDANRPAEKDTERVAWLLTSSFLAGLLVDAGYVQTLGGIDMDATDYRGRRPQDLLVDCGQVSGRNFYSYFDDAQRVHALWYYEWDAIIKVSPVRISNDETELDSYPQGPVGPTLTFAPEKDATLHIDPSNVASGVYVPYGTGSAAEYRTDAGTAARFGHRDIVTPNSGISTAGTADALGDHYLTLSADEDYTITLSVKINHLCVTQIQQGDIIYVHLTHLPGVVFSDGKQLQYGVSFWPCRITNMTIEQSEKVQVFYLLTLDLSPIPMGGG